MKKFFVAANIVGTATITAESIEAAQKQAENMSPRKFLLRPKPAGVMVFDTENMPKEEKPDDRVTT